LDKTIQFICFIEFINLTVVSQLVIDNRRFSLSPAA